MSELKTSVLVDLRGNLSRQARRMLDSMKGFGRGTRREMSAVDRSVAATGRGMSRLGRQMTGVLSGAAVLAGLKGLVALEARLKALKIDAGITEAQLRQLKTTIFETAQDPKIRLDPSKIISSLEEILSITGNIKFATEAIEGLGIVIRATGASGSSIGQMASELEKAGVAGKDVVRLLDILNVQGKTGAFTSKQFGSLGPRIFGAYRSTGRGGPDFVREVGAVIQAIQQVSGSPEQTVTSLEALIRDLGNARKVKRLRQLGIEPFEQDGLDRGEEILRALNELLVEFVIKTKGKRTVQSRIFGEEAARGLNALNAEFKETDTITSMQRFYNVISDGSRTLEDAADAASTADAALTDLTTTIKRGADFIGTPLIKGAASAANFIGPEATVGGAVALGGFAASRILKARKAAKAAANAGDIVEEMSPRRSAGFRVADKATGTAAKRAAGRGLLTGGLRSLGPLAAVGVAAAAAVSAPVLLAGAAALTLAGGGLIFAARKRQQERAEQALQSGTGPGGAGCVLRAELTVRLDDNGRLRVSDITADERTTVNVDHGPSMAGSQ